jgi:hypothetical protein
LEYLHTTYATDIKLATVDGIQGNLYLSGLDGDFLFYDGVFYGDWSVFAAEDMEESWRARVRAYDLRKASLPANINAVQAGDTTTYKIYWRWRGHKEETVVYASLTEEERKRLSSSLTEIQNHVDVARFRTDKVDAELVSEEILDFVRARAAIAEALGVHALP